MGCSSSCQDSLHRGSGDVCQGNVSLLFSRDVSWISCVSLSARYDKATCQGEILFLGRCYHQLKYTQFCEWTFPSLKCVQKVIVKEKLSSVFQTLKLTGALPHLVGRIISSLPLLFHCPHFVFCSLVTKCYSERIL